MLRVFWVLRVFRMFRMFRMFWVLLPTGMLRILGWPLLAALRQPGRATKRMLLEFHARMLGVRASSARGARSPPTFHRHCEWRSALHRAF